MKKLATALFLLLLMQSFIYAEEEKITITTYYPSPYGVYKNLRIHPSDSRPNTAAEGLAPGLMIFNNSTEKLEYYNGTKWQALGSPMEDCHWKRKTIPEAGEFVDDHGYYSVEVDCAADEFAVTGGAACGKGNSLDDSRPVCGSGWSGDTCTYAKGWFADCSPNSEEDLPATPPYDVYVLCCKK